MDITVELKPVSPFSVEEIRKIAEKLVIPVKEENPESLGHESSVLDQLDIWVNSRYIQEQVDQDTGKLRSAGAGRDDYFHAGRRELLEQLRAQVKIWRAEEALRETRRIRTGSSKKHEPSVSTHKFLEEIRAEIKKWLDQGPKKCSPLGVLMRLQRAGYRRIEDVSSQKFAEVMLDTGKGLSAAESFMLQMIKGSEN